MSGNKILLVDDESAILELYEFQLRSEFQIDWAVGGQEGIAMLAAHGPYAVVVSDMHMVGMSGIEFLHHVRSVSPESLRMMLTSDNRRRFAEKALKDGDIFLFLTKPCPAERLADAIRAGLACYRLDEEQPEPASDMLTENSGV